MKKLFFIMAFVLVSSIIISQVFASRALKVVADLDHNKGTIGTYRALIIGIQNYNDPKIPDLQTPLNDARAIADVLQNKYGFKVVSLLDGSATKKAMYDSLRNLSSKTKDEDSVLIYYAGHGDLDRQYDDGWWIPVDAKGGDPVTYLDNVQIQKAMRSMKAKHVLLISDSCYSGTLFGQARAMPSVINDKYYLNLYNEKSRWGMTSGNKTPVSDSGTGGNSVFAYQLIKKLKSNNKPYISTQEIYTDIAPVIANNSEQQPLCRPIKGTGDQGGEFIFVSTVTTNQYQPNKISAPQVAAPKSKKVYFDDIVRAGEKQGEIQKQWKDWQSDREDEYNQAKRLDKNTNLNTSQKKEAWFRFSSGVSQDNPFSTRDDEMRIYAGQRISYWENESSNKKKFAKQAVKSERKPIKLASINPIDKQPKIVDRDGQYIKYKSGVVYDKKTGLEWLAGPDKSLHLTEAKFWISEINKKDTGWRMPSFRELKTLYKNKPDSNNITSLLSKKDLSVWPDQLQHGWAAESFSFHSGEIIQGSYLGPFVRAFAVRKKKNQPIITGNEKFNKKVSVRISSVDQADKSAGVIARDGQYVKYKSGVVYDKKTGLEWLAGPDKSLHLSEAKFWISEINKKDTGWRMPSFSELKTLYKNKPDSNNITSLLSKKDLSVWPDQLQHGWAAEFFSFRNGEIIKGSYLGPFVRAFAVRKKRNNIE